MKNATYLIGKHLVVERGSSMSEPCALCRAAPGTGFRTAEIIGDSFMDHEWLSGGGYICCYCAACLGHGQPRADWIKNSSFLATESSLLRLKREDIWDRLLNPPEAPFVFGVTYTFKKHVSFKSSVNIGGQRPFAVHTENDKVMVDPEGLHSLLATMQAWYTIREQTSQEPTWFTKNDILQGCSNFKRIEMYGADRYLPQDNIIRPFRGTALLALLCHALNKKDLK